MVNPVKLIVAAERTLRAVKPSNEYKTVRTEQGELSIRVAPGNINRALRIMDVLVKCWRRRGYRIEFKDWDTIIHLRKVTQRVRLWEITTKIPKETLHGYQLFEPTGKLAFKMEYYLGKEWRDGNQFLEDQILDILNQMEVAARQLEKGWAEQAEKDKLREAAKQESLAKPETVVEPVVKKSKGKLKNKKAFRKLIKQAVRWKELKVLDEYLTDLFYKQNIRPNFWRGWNGRKING